MKHPNIHVYSQNVETNLFSGKLRKILRILGAQGNFMPAISFIFIVLLTSLIDGLIRTHSSNLNLLCFTWKVFGNFSGKNVEKFKEIRKLSEFRKISKNFQTLFRFPDFDKVETL